MKGTVLQAVASCVPFELVRGFIHQQVIPPHLYKLNCVDILCNSRLNVISV